MGAGGGCARGACISGCISIGGIAATLGPPANGPDNPEGGTGCPGGTLGAVWFVPGGA